MKPHHATTVNLTCVLPANTENSQTAQQPKTFFGCTFRLYSNSVKSSTDVKITCKPFISNCVCAHATKVSLCIMIKRVNLSILYISKEAVLTVEADCHRDETVELQVKHTGWSFFLRHEESAINTADKQPVKLSHLAHTDTHLHASKGPPFFRSSNIPSLLLPGLHLSIGEQQMGRLRASPRLIHHPGWDKLIISTVQEKCMPGV